MLDPPIFRLICIRNGYTKNYDTYANNQRMRKATIKGVGCSAITVGFRNLVDLDARELHKDAYDPTTVHYPCDTASVRLEISEVFEAGDGSNNVGLSEIEFYETWP